MFKNVTRITKPARSFSTAIRISAIRPSHRLSFSAARTIASTPKNQLLRRGFIARTYSATVGENETSESLSKQQSDHLLELLESAAKAPWLSSTPPDHHDRFRRAYILLFHIICYLGRQGISATETEVQQFLLAFNSAPVSFESEIGRARCAVGLLTKIVTSNISSIPESAPVRTQHKQVFALVDALVPLCDFHLEGIAQGTTPTTTGEVVGVGKWQDFWTKAQPVVLALAEELDKSGFGISEELMKEAIAEKEKRDRESGAPAEEEKK